MYDTVQYQSPMTSLVVDTEMSAPKDVELQIEVKYGPYAKTNFLKQTVKLEFGCSEETLASYLSPLASYEQVVSSSLDSVSIFLPRKQSTYSI